MTSNTPYEMALANLKNREKLITVIVFVSSCALCPAFLLTRNFEYFLFYPLTNIIVVGLSMLCSQEYFSRTEMDLMLEYGVVDRAWKAETEQRLSNVASRLATALHVKPVRVQVIPDGERYRVFHTKYNRSLCIALRAVRELDDKQLEFHIADSLIRYYWNLLQDRYGFLVFMLLVTLGLPFLALCPKGEFPRYLGLSLIFTLLLLAVTCIVSTITDTKKYKRILSVTRDFESAKTALIVESELSSKIFGPKMSSILSEIRRRRGSSEESINLSFTGVSRKINKLRQAAGELGLIKVCP